MRIHIRRKERFIADGSLSLAQFYYRNNVKAASFEAARSEIALTSKTAYFCSSCVPRVYVCVAHMERHAWSGTHVPVCGNIVGGCTLISTFHAMRFLEAENADDIEREFQILISDSNRDNIDIIIYLVPNLSRKLFRGLNSSLDEIEDFNVFLFILFYIFYIFYIFLFSNFHFFFLPSNALRSLNYYLRDVNPG